MRAARVELNPQDLEAHLERARAALGEEGYEQLKAAVETLAYLTQLVENKNITIQRLRQIIFGPSTETTSKVLKSEEGSTPATSEANPATPGGNHGAEPPEKDLPKKVEHDPKGPGHGRNGASRYSGANKIPVRHESLKWGDACPECQKGKVYPQKTPALLVRLVGRAPIGGTVYELEKLRCNLCGEIFTAEAPEGVGSEKYDETSASMIALLKYGSGLPFHRLERLQESVGIPLPASTQWEIVEETAAVIEPVYQELIRQAAQGEVLHNDDTTMKVLALMRGNSQNEDLAKNSEAAAPERSGVFTSGIVSSRQGRQIALFFTGRKHAGENLTDVLRRRASGLGPPIQMCDALSRNLSQDFQAIVANCLAHARRQFVDVAQSFPQQCRYVLETLREVYNNDALAKEQGLSAEERLRFHQQRSGPLMNEFEKWLQEQLSERKAEPNSGLGTAIAYMKNHWTKLTLFLRVPGAPLDNNVCERALKKAILHRKGSLFYKTENGARVGDLFMSLIHSCQLCASNPFDYLTELQKHTEEVAQQPQDWMPWNYRETLARAGAPMDSG
jgi:transposase